MITKILKRSIENPAVPLSDPSAFDMFSDGPSSSGVNVNAATAMTYPAVWGAVNLISKAVAKLPLVVYKRAGTGKERDISHDAFSLLRYRPSENYDAYQFLMTIVAWALLRGNGYASIENTSSGVKGLRLLAPEMVTPKQRGGELVYEVNSDGAPRDVDRNDIFHVKGLSNNGIVGESVITNARESFGLGMAALRYGGHFFANSAKPSVVLEHPGKVSKEAAQNLRRSWDATHGGIEKSNRPAVLEQGMKLNVFGLSNEDSQFLQTREFEIREVANWFNVPPHLLGDPTRTSHSSLESESQAFLDNTLDPWLVCIESEAREKLLSEDEKARDTHIVEFTRQALIRVNMSDRGAFYNLGIQGGWLSRDEVRGKENLNPIPDGAGEIFLEPLNMQPAGERSEEESDDNSEGNRTDLETACRMVLQEFLSRQSLRIVNAAKRVARSEERGFSEWVQGGRLESHRVVFCEAAIPVVALMEATNRDMSIDSLQLEFFSFWDKTLPLLDVEDDADKKQSNIDELGENLQRQIIGGFNGRV